MKKLVKIGKIECRITYNHQGLTDKTKEKFNNLMADEIRRVKK